MTEAERSIEAARIARHARVALRLARLVVAAADEAGFSLRLFRSAKQHRRLVEARKACCVAARAIPVPSRRHGHYAYQEIGRALNRDHSTVMAHVRAAERAGRGHPSHKATDPKGAVQ
jgi:chromosomal replication initiation ATPase DnaA